MQDGTKQTRPRGRPRLYEPEAALARAREVFWSAGYNGTSLDALAAATGMNRPSLYAAFGNKQAIYLRLIERFSAEMERSAGAALDAESGLADALRGFYRAALRLYFSGDDGPRGCFVFCTAIADAPVEPALRAALAGTLRALDQRLAARFRRALADGELAAGAEPRRLAALAAATLHSLALRSRAGQSRASLEALVEQAVALLAPPAPQRPRRRRPARRPM